MLSRRSTDDLSYMSFNMWLTYTRYEAVLNPSTLHSSREARGDHHLLEIGEVHGLVWRS
jgi:hypothetical protein